MSVLKQELPWLTRLKLLVFHCCQRLVQFDGNTINRRINNFLDVKSPAPTTKLITSTTLLSISDVPIQPSRDLWFRLFVPTTAAASTNSLCSGGRLPFILYFHGGGFCTLGPDSFAYTGCSSLLAAETPAIIASVNYRLAPEHRYPCQYEDAFDALKFINSQNYSVLPANTDLDRCFIAGDSAGANIAHHVTVRAFQNSHELDKLKIVGLLLMQPFFGGEERTESELRLRKEPILDVDLTDKMWRSFLPEGANRDHPGANVLNSARLDNVDFPKTLVVVGGRDPLQDWQRRYVEWMKECGKEVKLIEYPNAFHAFQLFQEVAEFKMLIEDLREFLRSETLN